MEDQEFQVNKQFLRFKGKNVIVSLKNEEECEGTLVAIDNYLNIVLEKDGALQTLKGVEVLYIAEKN